MASDYGLYLHDHGHPAGMSHVFPSVLIDHVSLVDGVHFSTMAHTVVDGTEHAVSFDFGPEVFQQLVGLAPEQVQDQIRATLRGITRLPRTIEFSRAVTCRVEAVLGQRQRGRTDEFIPLVVSRVAREAA
jgi:hypothetical protein